jgi:uncharacterized repeat protein (TIGR01451 family)
VSITPYTETFCADAIVAIAAKAAAIANFFIAGSGDNSSILPTQAAPAPALSNNSKTLTWALGDLVNLDRDNSITESVILEFNALVDNISATKKGTTLENSGQFNFNGIRFQSNKVTAAVVEPQFEITKTVAPSSGSDAGDLLNYNVVLKNIGNSDAFNLQVDDALGNLGTNFDLQSVAIDSQPALANASISSSITNAASAATGDRVQVNIPRVVNSPYKFSAVSVYDYMACGIRADDRKGYCWGWGSGYKKCS